MSYFGLDIGTNSLKIVEIEISKKKEKPLLTKWAVFEIPPDLRNKHPEREHYQADLLKRFCAKSSSKSAIIVVSGLDVVCKIISLPNMGTEEAVEAVKWQMKDEIPFKVEEGVFSLYKLNSPTKEKTNFMVAVAKEEMVLRALQSVSMAGIRPTAIIPVSEALFNIFRDDLQTPDGIVCLLSMGQFLTNISFYDKGVLQLSRDVPIGSEDITRAMTSILVSEEGRLELDYEQAEKIRSQYGIPIDLENYPKLEHIPIAHLQAVVRPALERIEEEITRTIEYYRNKINDANLVKMIFTGSASQTPHLADFLSNSIGIDFETVDVFSKIGIADDVGQKDALVNFGARLNAAMGASLLGAAKTNINLIPREYLERWRVILKKYLTAKNVGAGIAMILLVVWSTVASLIYVQEAEKQKITAQIDQLQPMVTQLEATLQTSQELAKRAGYFKAIEEKKIKIPALLAELSRNVPPEVVLEELAVSPTGETVSIKGLAFEKNRSAEENLSKLIVQLSKSSFFKNVELVQAGQGLDYIPKNFKFEINSRIAREK